eukprot:10973407-Alexandrium_andersonii.AAC.1
MAAGRPIGYGALGVDLQVVEVLRCGAMTSSLERGPDGPDHIHSERGEWHTPEIQDANDHPHARGLRVTR